MICYLCLLTFSIFGQKKLYVGIEAEPEVLTVGEVLSIKVTIRNSQNSDVEDFPKIKGFRKEGKSVSHANVLVDGKKTLQHIVTQNYRALEWGTFDLPNYEFKINGEVHVMPASEINVINSENAPEIVFSDTLSNEDALLFLFVNKKDIVVGEGFKIHLAFYVSEDNTASWAFPKNLSKQVSQISQKLKPPNCFESRKEIVNILPEPATINGKKYIRYKFFESIYYPLSTQDFVLPSVRFDIDKITMATDSSSATVVKAFYSRPFTIHVSDLPEHPMKNRVSVGNFQLEELNRIGDTRTGKFVNYALRIKGEGNFKTMLFDKPENNSHFDFYPPQTIEKQLNGSDFGEKVFTFKVFPKDSGAYNMREYFQWIFYNTAKRDYDTLRANQKLTVSGPTIITYSATSKSIYENLEELSIADKNINYRNIVKNTVNVCLFLMLAGMLFIFDFRRNQRQN